MPQHGSGIDWGPVDAAGQDDAFRPVGPALLCVGGLCFAGKHSQQSRIRSRTAVELKLTRHLQPPLELSLFFVDVATARAPCCSMKLISRALCAVAAGLIGGASAQSDECTASTAAGFDFQVGLCDSLSLPQSRPDYIPVHTDTGESGE